MEPLRCPGGHRLSVSTDAQRSHSQPPAEVWTTAVAARALEHVKRAYFVLDADFRYVYINLEAERLIGRARTDLLGHSVWEVFPDIVGTKVEQQYRRVAAENVSSKFENYYAAAERWYKLEVDPVPGTGVIVGFEDITDQKRTEEELARSKDVLGLISAAHLFGWFRWLIPEDQVLISTEIYAFYGLTPGTVRVDSIFWRSQIHADDRPAVEALVRKVFRDRTASASFEFRTRPADGKWRWMTCRANVTYDLRGKPLAMTGVNIDITDRKDTESELLRIRHNLETAQHIARVGSWDKDLASGNIWWSAETCRIFGVAEGRPMTGDDF
jgi:PAS domain S-box-containing protein